MIEVPTVSVIIPTYNRAHLIRKSLESVLNQTFDDFEIIVFDDGSTDDTEKVVKQFTDERIRCLRHEQNRGAAAARNTGIRAARGDYIAFLDSDDEWLPHKLAKQLTALQSAPASVGASCTASYHIFGQRVKKHVPVLSGTWLRTLLWGCDLNPGATLLVSRRVLDDVGLLDETLPRYEDWDWLIRCVKKYDLLLLEQPLARVYRRFYSSADVIEISTLQFVTKHKSEFGIFGWYYGRRLLARRWLEVARTYYRQSERNLQKEREYFLKTILANPILPPMVYLALIDAIFGTSIKPWVSKIKRRLLARLRLAGDRHGHSD